MIRRLPLQPLPITICLCPAECLLHSDSSVVESFKFEGSLKHYLKSCSMFNFHTSYLIIGNSNDKSVTVKMEIDINEM